MKAYSLITSGLCTVFAMSACPADDTTPAESIDAQIDIEDNQVMHLAIDVYGTFHCEISVDEANKQARILKSQIFELAGPGSDLSGCVAILKKPVNVTLETLAYRGKGQPYANDSSTSPWIGEIVVDLTTWNDVYVPVEGWSRSGHVFCARQENLSQVRCTGTRPNDAGN